MTIQSGTKVKMNIDALNGSSWEGLTPGDNALGIDYVSYIQEDEERVYTVDFLREDPNLAANIVLKDELLSATSFSKAELIVVWQPSTQNGALDEQQRKAFEQEAAQLSASKKQEGYMSVDLVALGYYLIKGNLDQANIDAAKLEDLKMLMKEAEAHLSLIF